MNEKELLEKKKQLTLESYVIDAQLAPCLKCFVRTGDEFEFKTKTTYSCDKCLSEICFVQLENGEVEEPNCMYN